jgi:hypothetical protein
MARFSKNTLVQLAGFDADVIAEEILFGQDDYWNITVTDGTPDNLPQDLSNWTFQFRLIRRKVDDVIDTRNGLELVNLQPASGATVLVLDDNVKVFDPVNGKVRLLIDDQFFTSLPPVIDALDTPVYTGYFGAVMPSIGTAGDLDYVPPQMKKKLLCFIVRSDGISSQTV